MPVSLITALRLFVESVSTIMVPILLVENAFLIMSFRYFMGHVPRIMVVSYSMESVSVITDVGYFIEPLILCYLRIPCPPETFCAAVYS
jgi:hypothetical protein